jgi:hypothetical protein
MHRLEHVIFLTFRRHPIRRIRHPLAPRELGQKIGGRFNRHRTTDQNYRRLDEEHR